MNSKDLMHPYQWDGVHHVIENSHSGLFLDMGLGKTVTVLTAVNRLIYEALLIDKALVVAPKRVAESVWKQEAAKWEHLKHLRVSIISGTVKQRLLALNTPADIYTVSRDNIAWLCGLFGGSSLPFQMLAVDESSSFKNPKSQRFRALKLVQPSFDWVVLMTGTPAPNSLIDLWSQIYLIDRGERLGKTVTQYREVFFSPAKVNGFVVYSYALRTGSEERIHTAISDVCISMKASDYLQLPERITNLIEIEMPPAIAAAYKEFEREQVLELFENDTVITAANAAALSNKLLQFANGAVYDAEGNYHVVHDLKLEALAEIMEQSQGHPVLVAYAFRSDAERIERYLKAYKPRRLKTDEDILAWNRGELPLMIMHPASGGHGLNLQQGGHTIVWFGPTWSLELQQQFDARIDRQGQTKTPIIHKLLIKKTMDEEVIKATDRKEKGQDGLMAAVKFRINEILKK